VTFLGRNTGWTGWGPPTGRTIALSQIVNRYVRAGAVREEHAIHNTAALARQLGHEPVALARRAARGRGGFAIAPADGEPEWQVGPGLAQPAAAHGEAGIEAWARQVLHELYNERRLDRVATHFAADLRFHGSADRELYGRDDYVANVLETLAMVPDATYRVEHAFSQPCGRETHVVVARWSLDGTHRGWGRFGAPTGRRLRQWGLTHLRVRDGRIAEEWTYSNEFDTWQQIHSEEAA
jgi:predicted ester cyclase